jgi:hypothetical protein
MSTYSVSTSLMLACEVAATILLTIMKHSLS